MSIRKPLLYGEITADFMIRKQPLSYRGVSPVGSHKIPGIIRLAFFFVANRYGITVIPFFKIQGGNTVPYLRMNGNQRLQPEIKLMTIHIDVKPLVISFIPCFQIYGSHRKDLGIYQHLQRQS